MDRDRRRDGRGRDRRCAAAVALGAPDGLTVSPPVTQLAPHLTWTRQRRRTSPRTTSAHRRPCVRRLQRLGRRRDLRRVRRHDARPARRHLLLPGRRATTATAPDATSRHDVRSVRHHRRRRRFASSSPSPARRPAEPCTIVATVDGCRIGRGKLDDLGGRRHIAVASAATVRTRAVPGGDGLHTCARPRSTSPATRRRHGRVTVDNTPPAGCTGRQRCSPRSRAARRSRGRPRRRDLHGRAHELDRARREDVPTRSCRLDRPGHASARHLHVRRDCDRLGGEPAPSHRSPGHRHPARA